MITVVAAVIEREDRRLLIGQRRRNDTSPLKWEFPGGKVENGETPKLPCRASYTRNSGPRCKNVLRSLASATNTPTPQTSLRFDFTPLKSLPGPTRRSPRCKNRSSNSPGSCPKSYRGMISSPPMRVWSLISLLAASSPKKFSTTPLSPSRTGRQSDKPA
jgi:hypothetical protein